MITPTTPTANPMFNFSQPVSPGQVDQQILMQQLMMLLGGLGMQGPHVPPQPQPQQNQMSPLLGGPI